MQNFDQYARRPAVGTVSNQQALADFMWKTYAWMSGGLALTGIVAFVVSQSPVILEIVVGNSVVFYGLIIAELAMVFAFSMVVHKVSQPAAAGMFLGYSALNGLTMSVIFLLYTQASIASTFVISAGAFAGLSFVGAVTKKDLSAMGRFMYFGLFGLIIGSVVNIWMASPALYWITTFGGIVIFAGLTAYDTQKLRQLFIDGGEAGNLALRGALTLYLDFINLFLFLLRLLGRRR